MTIKDVLNFEARQATKDGVEVLEQARSALLRAAEELDSRIEYIQSDVSLYDRAQGMNSALHYCSSNILGNLRLDLMAGVQARMMAANFRLKDLEEALYLSYMRENDNEH